MDDLNLKFGSKSDGDILFEDINNVFVNDGEGLKTHSKLNRFFIDFISYLETGEPELIKVKVKDNNKGCPRFKTVYVDRKNCMEFINRHVDMSKLHEAGYDLESTDRQLVNRINAICDTLIRN